MKVRDLKPPKNVSLAGLDPESVTSGMSLRSSCVHRCSAVGATSRHSLLNNIDTLRATRSERPRNHSFGWLLLVEMAESVLAIFLQLNRGSPTSPSFPVICDVGSVEGKERRRGGRLARSSSRPPLKPPWFAGRANVPLCNPVDTGSGPSTCLSPRSNPVSLSYLIYAF